jgi:DNA-binding NtrC family response regulator
MSNANFNVLVVDDDLAICRILHRMLSDEGYQVQCSQSVADALVAIERKPFDFYVMDYKLPDGTGLDIAERIRSTKSDAPIILISVYDPVAVSARSEKLRIFDTIAKPFSREAICNAVKKAIQFLTPIEQSNEKAVSSMESVATKQRFPRGALLGAITFFLLLSGVAIYLITYGH